MSTERVTEGRDVDSIRSCIARVSDQLDDWGNANVAHEQLKSLLAELDRRDAALRKLVALIDSHGWMEKVNGDWSCAECRPDSDMLVEGFRCAYHGARALANAPNDSAVPNGGTP